MSKNSFVTCAALGLLMVLLFLDLRAPRAFAQAQTPAPAPAAPLPFTLPPEPKPAPTGMPTATADLLTPEGVALFKTQWKAKEARIVEGPLSPNAKSEYKTAYDLSPHAAVAGFDDSSWPTLAPESLRERRGAGRVTFIWYRVNLTIPERIGGVETSGAKVALTVNVDDYAEVVVNGTVARRGGVSSPAAISGFIVDQRVLLTEAAKPGEKFEVAVLAINGPFAQTPINVNFNKDNTGPPGFINFRKAAVELFR